MFDSLKRLIGPRTSTESEGRVLSEWAQAQGHVFKRVKEKSGGGFVVEAAQGWRVEWGDSQRSYIRGKELRFRCDTGLAGDVQLIMVSKVLAQTLETEVFSSYTHAMQTQVDTSLPDEMRWLAMHQRMSLAASPVLSKRFALISNAEPLTQAWLNEPMLQAFDAAASTWWTDALLLVLTINRSMLTVRMAGQPLEPAQLKLVGDLFTQAALRLREVASQR